MVQKGRVNIRFLCKIAVLKTGLDKGSDNSHNEQHL
jgi:hypothetical protein